MQIILNSSSTSKYNIEGDNQWNFVEDLIQESKGMYKLWPKVCRQGGFKKFNIGGEINTYRRQKP